MRLLKSLENILATSLLSSGLFLTLKNFVDMQDLTLFGLTTLGSYVLVKGYNYLKPEANFSKIAFSSVLILGQLFSRLLPGYDFNINERVITEQNKPTISAETNSQINTIYLPVVLNNAKEGDFFYNEKSLEGIPITEVPPIQTTTKPTETLIPVMQTQMQKPQNTPTITPTPYSCKDYSSQGFSVISKGIWYKKVPFTTNSENEYVGTACYLKNCNYHLLIVDLNQNGITVTSDIFGYGRTTKEFVTSKNGGNENIILGISGDEWDERSNSFKPLGLHVYNGKILNPPSEEQWSPVLYVFKDGHVEIGYEKDFESIQEDILHAISGISLIVENGLPNPEKFNNPKSSYNSIVPRSAIGISSDGKTLFVFVSDVVFQSGYQEGMTLRFVAERLAELGAKRAFTLSSGGGSSFFSEEGYKNYVSLASGSSEQVRSNNIGIFPYENGSCVDFLK
ncbi:MAG: phosphodiester glycosidase family protein [Candidatus Woesearchaeota archaeon]